MTTHQSTPPLPLSVCLIAGNEAARIRRTLKNVAGWTAEIVIVINDDVTDGTDGMATEFGAKVFREPWKGFGLQKQSSAEKCTQPWLLNLDADETISPELRLEITNLLADESRCRSHVAYSFPRCTLYSGRWIRHGDWYPDRQIRLWQRGQAHWSTDMVHEKLKVEGTIGQLRGELLHYSMDNLNHHVRKIIDYSDIFARQQAGRKIGALELGFRPWWRFVRSYLLRRGFLDGWQGYAVARLAAVEVFLRYAKIREAKVLAEKLDGKLGS
jgi:glycosyltransferase involved in cell wall biosynthesis